MTYRLIYASRISPACVEAMKPALTDIITRSLAKNRAAGITSLLVAHQGWFVQALEGERRAVREMFDRVALDPRHHQPKPLMQGPIEERLCEQWAFGARVLTSNDEAVLSALNTNVPFDPLRAPERTLTRLLANVADVHWRVLGEQQTLAA